MRTDEKLNALCERLSHNCGDIHDAARYCELTPHFVMQWIKDDSVAAGRVLEAQRTGWLGLETEAIRRAVRGVEEEIYYKGEVVGTKQVFSDGLLGKLLEARVPEYSKKEGGGNTFMGPTQINIMPRATNYEEWLAMRDKTLELRDLEALPAPDTTVDAEYTELTDRPLASLEGLL